MPEHQQAAVAGPVVAAFRGVEQFFHLEAGEVLAAAVLFLPAARPPPRFCRFPSIHRFVESLPCSKSLKPLQTLGGLFAVSTKCRVLSRVHAPAAVLRRCACWKSSPAPSKSPFASPHIRSRRSESDPASSSRRQNMWSTPVAVVRACQSLRRPAQIRFWGADFSRPYRRSDLRIDFRRTALAIWTKQYCSKVPILRA